MIYRFTKPDVCLSRLREEILHAISVAVAVRKDGDELSIISMEELTPTQVDQLNALVVAHTGEPLVKDRVEILNDIFTNAEADVQAPRLLTALNSNAAFIAALDNYNYPLARNIVATAVAQSILLAEDEELIHSTLPSPIGVY